MVIQSNIKFVEHTKTPIVSRSFFNSTGDVLALQISGGPGSVRLEGRTRKEADWTNLAGINLADFTVAKGEFTQAGLYELSIIGIREMRVKIDSVEGEISVFGQIISSEET